MNAETPNPPSAPQPLSATAVKLRRYDMKKLLADPELRRKLIVQGTIATQAREGIDVSQIEAEDSYYVVTQAERAAFFGLMPFRSEAGENDGRHIQFVSMINDLHSEVRTDVSLRDFGGIEGAPIAYDKLGLVGPLFRDNPKLDPAHATAAQGLATADDPRFVRCWWETPVESSAQSLRWRPFAKGGSYSRFYSDIFLVVNWGTDGTELKEWAGSLYNDSHWSRIIKNTDLYFRAGLSWPLRTQRGFNIRKLPPSAVFGHKGPAVIPNSEGDIDYLLGVLNSRVAEYMLRCFSAFGSWEVGAVKKIPIPKPNTADAEPIAVLAKCLHDKKAAWDTGNEICTRFDRQWVLQSSLNNDARTLGLALDATLDREAKLDAELTETYAQLNTAVYRLYGVNDILRAKIDAAIGERPPELVWPQMEGQDRDQKRREHVDRLLTYLVKRIVVDDEDHLVCLQRVAHEPALIERLRTALAACFPDQDPSSLETEVVNELKKKTKGYHRAETLAEWLHDVFFGSHNALYQQRPILWHLASNQTRTEPGFACIVHAHRFDRDALAKLRGVYIRDRIAVLKREAAQAGQDGKADLRLDLLALAEEVEAYDTKLALLQEGALAGPEGGDRDYRILTPWKTSGKRPQGWNPDLDDGIKVNLAPLARTNLLRIKLKLGLAEAEE